MAVQGLVSVTFIATTYRNPRKGFSFPTEVYHALGFHGGSKVALFITTLTDVVVFCGISTFISGPEITEAGVVKHLSVGKKIRVTASPV